jgi:predicted DsbA family dithiol-disulfide isomerase
MNVLAPPRISLSLEVVIDLVCPWCYIGTRRLRRTLRRRPDLAVAITWRPFLLNPDMPRAGLSRSEYILRKFGGEERARRLHASIATLGRGEGIAFHFERIRRTPSSIDAHRLVRFAAASGRADAAVEALFAAHFTDGHDIGDPSVLAAIAAALGLDPARLRRLLASDADVDVIQAENLRAHRIGINGVPCFVVAGRHAIAGAQEPEVLERLLDVAAAEA